MTMFAMFALLLTSRLEFTQQTSTKPDQALPASTAGQAPPQTSKPAEPPVAKSAEQTPVPQIMHGVMADPNPFIVGQTITFSWPEVVSRVQVSGGDLKKPVKLSGKTFFTAAPRKAMTYTFDLWFPAPSSPGKATSAVGSPAAITASSTPQAAPLKSPVSHAKTPSSSVAKVTAEIHQHFKVEVEVQKGIFPHLWTLRDKYPWRIDYLDGWKAYPVTEVDEGHTLVYLQPEEDAPERIAIASWPVSDLTSATLMEKVVEDAASEYDVLEDKRQKETLQAGEPATWLTFRGIARTLPNIPTQSIELTLIHKNRGFVISARARASKLETMGNLLRCLVRSFSFTPAPEVIQIPFAPEPVKAVSKNPQKDKKDKNETPTPAPGRERNKSQK